VWQVLADQYWNAALWTIGPVKPLTFLVRNTLLVIGFVNERDFDAATQWKVEKFMFFRRYAVRIPRHNLGYYIQFIDYLEKGPTINNEYYI
jgi:hypothetical protein